MKCIRHAFIIAALLLVTSTPCWALWLISEPTKEQAAELGIEVWSKVMSTNQVGVWLELKPQGKLKDFDHVELEIVREGKTLVSARLLPTRQSEDRVTVAFYADPSHFEISRLTVYVRGGLGGVAYRLKVKDVAQSGMPQ
jgi:hypothetical protein